MKKIAIASCVGLMMVGALSAQEHSHFAFNIGAGFTQAVGDTGQRLDLGWNGRLNGPVDNPQSSCMSCHMTAEYPALSAMSPLFTAKPPPVGSKDWMRWFQNEKCAVPFDAKAKSSDFSLQLAISLQNFDAGYTNLAGIYASPPNPTPPKKVSAMAAPGELEMKAMAPSEAAKAAKEIEPVSDGNIIHPIVRDVLETEPPK